MPVTRKRKAVSPEPTKQTASASQKTISSYGRVTKSQPADQSVKKRRTIDTVHIDTTSSIHNASIPAQKPAQPEAPEQPAAKTQIKQKQPKKRLREAEEEEVVTPQNKRFRNALPPTPAETPSKSASKLFEQLNIDNKSAHPSAITSQQQNDYDTPPLTPRSFKSLGSSISDTELPARVEDLSRLFSAFLTSTSLYCAHNGLGSPMYLTALLPHVTKSWKKRAVTERDIRSLLGILGENNTFELADNGEGHLCLELVENANTASGHFNQPQLTQQFRRRLDAMWKQWASVSPAAKQNIDGFLKQLPDCQVVTSEVAPSKTGNLSKGRERLNDLKNAAVSARAAEAASRKPLVKAESRTAAAVATRTSNLIDRILAKQAANETRGSGPTQEELDRRAALDRIQDISQVLDLLANGRPRISFSTKALTSHLQNSLRNPISNEEAERCLNLMANEVTPNFVAMIQAGQVRGIVLTRGGRPSADELKQRLERARGGA